MYIFKDNKANKGKIAQPATSQISSKSLQINNKSKKGLVPDPKSQPLAPVFNGLAPPLLIILVKY